MRFTTTLITRNEWHEMNGLTRWREARDDDHLLGRPRNRYWSTDDHVTHAQREFGMTLEPGQRFGEYVQSAEKPKNPLDDETNA